MESSFLTDVQQKAEDAIQTLIQIELWNCGIVRFKNGARRGRIRRLHSTSGKCGCIPVAGSPKSEARGDISMLFLVMVAPVESGLSITWQHSSSLSLDA
jgi:hypothetical protein